MVGENTPKDVEHVQGKKPRLPQRGKQHQAENPDQGQQGDAQRRGTPDIERNFEDQAR